MPDSPNVVLVHCHDLGRHLGCHDRGVETPNIDSLAGSGVRFANYFCTAPQCSPSRGSMLTGTHPQRHGLMGLAHLGWDLDPDQSTLPGLFGDAGYRTCHVGMREEHPPGRLGFDRREEASTRALEVADRFADVLDDLEAFEGPFLASLGFSEPHRPYRVEYLEDAAYDRYDPAAVTLPPYLPDEPGVREDVAALNALVTATVDRAVGRVRDALEGAGLAAETLLVFTTDHGLAMPRAKGSPYDPGLETALILRQPGRFDGGAVREELLSNVDLLPTLLDTCGIAVPDGLDGRSFCPLLEGGESHRERVFAGMTWHDRYNPLRVVRTDRYKYVRNFADLPRVFLPGDVFDSASGRAVRGAYYTESRPAEELYDLRADPHERENLAPDRRPFEERVPCAHDDRLERFRGELREWMERTGDPLLSGPVPAPGAHEW